VFQVRAVYEHGQSRVVCVYGFLFGGGLLFEGGGYLQKDRFFLSVPAPEERLQPVSERVIRSDELTRLVSLRDAGEPEGEATQAVVQL